MNVNRNLIVGDIHGHYDKLMAALETAGFSDSDTLYSVGDLFDRGLENLTKKEKKSKRELQGSRLIRSYRCGDSRVRSIEKITL